jgi:hypothetical protein
MSELKPDFKPGSEFGRAAFLILQRRRNHEATNNQRSQRDAPARPPPFSSTKGELRVQFFAPFMMRGNSLDSAKFSS